jgi:hypothetical protein
VSQSAYDRSPCSPLLTDADKARISAKVEHLARNSEFFRAMLAHEEREPAPRAPEPPYRR